MMTDVVVLAGCWGVVAEVGGGCHGGGVCCGFLLRCSL